MKNMKILLIIPAYNEEESICGTYKTIVDYNIKHNTNYDVIVINDGSSDNTEKLLQNNNIPHLTLKSNLGIGGAVQTGYKYAVYNNYDICIQYDGDGQHDVGYVKDITKPIIENNYDLVIGSRFIDHSSSDFKSSGARRLGIKLISFFIKLTTGKRIYDTTSGFRASRRNVFSMFSKEYPHEYPEPITNARVLKKKFNVKEVPVSMNERTAGVSSIKPWKTSYFMINVIFTIILEGLGRSKNEH